MKSLAEFAPLPQSPAPALSPLLNQRIVALGGGTGLSTLLRGLHPLCFDAGTLSPQQRERLTAIVTVADDGGSSGALRRAYSVLAPGDIRNCLLALAGSDETLQNLFDFRFDASLGGHSMGNLILTALAQLECDFPRAVELAAGLLDVRGRVLPATADDVALEAEFADGSTIVGESKITQAGRRIRRISLVPASTRVLPAAETAIAGADMIIIGPGSLYTSLIPVLLVPGVVEAIARSQAKVVLIMNLMTEPGETDGYNPLDCIEALRSHLPQLPIHYSLINSAPLPGMHLQQYAREGALPISMDYRRVSELGCVPLFRDLVNSGDKVWHDPAKLGRAIEELVDWPAAQTDRNRSEGKLCQ